MNPRRFAALSVLLVAPAAYSQDVFKGTWKIPKEEVSIVLVPQPKQDPKATAKDPVPARYFKIGDEKPVPISNIVTSGNRILFQAENAYLLGTATADSLNLILVDPQKLNNRKSLTQQDIDKVFKDLAQRKEAPEAVPGVVTGQASPKAVSNVKAAIKSGKLPPETTKITPARCPPHCD
jgi:hypothetical protein